MHGEGAQGRFVEAGKDQLLLARIGVDVTDREDAWHRGLESCRVHHQLLALQRQPPLRDGPQRRVQAPEHQQVGGFDALDHAAAAAHARLRERTIGRLQSDDVAFAQLHAAFVAKRMHARDAGRRRAEGGGPMHQHHAACALDQRQRPVQCRIATAGDHDVLAFEERGVGHLVVHGASDQGLRFGQVEGSRRKGAQSPGDDRRTGIERQAAAGPEPQATVVRPPQRSNRLAQVEPRLERTDLLLQAFDQFPSAAHRKRRDVVDGLVRVQLDALPAGLRHRLDHMRAQSEQSQLEDLEQPDRAGTDDNDFVVDQ